MSQVKENTDNELMLQIVGYNSEAFQQLFNRYSPSLLGIIKEIISNPKLAESVLFNVFSVFLKRLDYFNTTTNNVYTYLTLLTRNVAIDVLKRMKFVEDIPIYSDEYEIEFILPGLSKEILTIDLDQRYMLGEQIKNYRSQLTEVQNLLLSLIYFEGLNEEEIAKRLNVPMVTVRQKVLAIMDTLHQQYAGQNSANHNDKAILELIKLEAVGFLTSEERMMLENLKENDPDFLWKELGEYQNMTALISASIPEQVISRNSSEELMTIFTQILLQDGEVQYPIIPSEIPIPEQETLKPVEKVKQTKNVVDDTINLVSVKQEEPVKVEQKESGFQLKFREPDPTELNILRKLERTESKSKTTEIVNKIDKETLQKEVKPVLPKPDVVISRIANSPKPKEIINQTLGDNLQVQNKVEVVPPKPAEIINDDPSIIIEETKPVIAKIEDKPVSRLTPTSNINIEDIIKKDLNPSVKRNNLVENSTLNNPIQSKKPEVEVKKPESKPVVVESPKPQLVQKPVVEKKEEIKFKVNQTPKEIKQTLEVISNQPPVVEAKKQEPEKFEIKFKTNETPKEIRSNTTVQIKPQPAIVKTEPEVTKVKSDIKFREQETPKEIKKVIQPQVAAQKPAEVNSANIKQEKPVEPKQAEPIKAKEQLPVKEVKVEKEIKPVENKVSPVISEISKNLKAEDAKKLSSLFKTRERKIEEPAKNTTSAESEKVALKIRETNFNEEVIKKEVSPKADPKIDEIKSVVENLLKDKKLTGTLTVDEVLAKLEANKKNNESQNTSEEKAVERIEEENEEAKVIFKDFSYEDEMAKINKQSRKKVIVYAAIFVLLTATGIFAYLNMQSENVNATSNINKVKQPVTEQQTNIIAGTETSEITAKNPDDENVITENEIKPEEKTTKEVDVKLPPLPESLEKKESTYFALNENNDLMVNQPKVNNQTAAAKTETTNPPKENKVKEEEPAFFVAVEEMPELVGGLKNLQTKIKYPEIAKRQGIEGKVLVQAIVDENGKVISANTIKGIGGGCDEVAIDAVKNSSFMPGKQRGKNVKVQVTIPIVFKK